MNEGEVLFKVENGKAYFQNGKGHGAEECIGIINGLVNVINSGAVATSAPQPQKPNNVVNYEDILDKRVINGDTSKSTLKLKEWLDNDPEILAEERVGMLHPECGGRFEFKDIEVKDITEYETGIEYIFDCPCCGKETSTLECE